jgi:tRNA nucleotidyltransferase (CCA-adding enzyme)
METSFIVDWKLDAETQFVVNFLEQHGGHVYVIGGTPRNLWWGEPIKDIDMEVFNLPADQLEFLLSLLGTVSLEGQQFAVFKLRLENGRTYDVALPRRERQEGQSSKDIQVVSDPYATVREAGYRRDYTINSLYWRPFTRELIDYHGAIQDLKFRVLRPISDAFSEDPLRPLRGFRLAAEYDLVLTNTGNARLMHREMLRRYHTIPESRIRDEWWKWAKSRYPASGLRFLDESGWLAQYPELYALIGCQQDAEWHPEGDAWAHTIDVVRAMQIIAHPSTTDWEQHTTLIFAALLHDVGKPDTTHRSTEPKTLGRWVSPGHDHVGAPIAQAFFKRIFGSEQHPIIDRVVRLVETHMYHVGITEVTKRQVLRLAHHTGSIENWYWLVVADHSGRPYRPGTLNVPPTAAKFLALASAMDLEVKEPEPILTGGHLLERGWKTGRALGDVKRAAFEAQLDDEFSDEEGALAWLNTNYPHGPS